MDDLDSEWETLRALPPTKALVEDVNLREERWGLADHPEFIYKIVDENFGLQRMSIWRYKCLGQRIVHSPYPKPVDCWVIQWDRVLWSGEFCNSVSPNPNPNAIRSTPKRTSYTSLEGVTRAFQVARDRALARYRDDNNLMRSEIAKREEIIVRNEGLIATMTGFIPPTLRVLDPDTGSTSEKSGA